MRTPQNIDIFPEIELKLKMIISLNSLFDKRFSFLGQNGGFGGAELLAGKATLIFTKSSNILAESKKITLQQIGARL